MFYSALHSRSRSQGQCERNKNSNIAIFIGNCHPNLAQQYFVAKRFRTYIIRWPSHKNLVFWPPTNVKVTLSLLTENCVKHQTWVLWALSFSPFCFLILQFYNICFYLFEWSCGTWLTAKFLTRWFANSDTKCSFLDLSVDRFLSLYHFVYVYTYLHF